MSEFTHHGITVTLTDIIQMVEATPEDAWQMDVVRSADGERNCFFGHLHAWASGLAAGLDESAVPAFYRTHNPDLTPQDHFASRVWDWFEDRWATTYAIYPVNDGTHPRYLQPTPRQRVLAYLRALESGEELDTHTSLEAHFADRTEDSA